MSEANAETGALPRSHNATTTVRCRSSSVSSRSTCMSAVTHVTSPPRSFIQAS